MKQFWSFTKQKNEKPEWFVSIAVLLATISGLSSLPPVETLTPRRTMHQGHHRHPPWHLKMTLSGQNPNGKLQMAPNNRAHPNIKRGTFLQTKCHWAALHPRSPCTTTGTWRWSLSNCHNRSQDHRVTTWIPLTGWSSSPYYGWIAIALLKAGNISHGLVENWSHDHFQSRVINPKHFSVITHTPQSVLSYKLLLQSLA